MLDSRSGIFLAKKNEKGPSAPSVKADHGSVAAGRDEYRKANAAFYIDKAERQRETILAAKGKL